jgi:hypothetical protein
MTAYFLQCGLQAGGQTGGGLGKEPSLVGFV